MNNDRALKLSISLQRMAYVKVATVLWANSATENKIRDYYAMDDDIIMIMKRDEMWARISLSVVVNSTLLGLPGKLVAELQNITFWIGNRLCNWIQYIRSLGFNVSFLKVHWTSEGLIDEKTIFSYWLNNPCQGAQKHGKLDVNDLIGLPPKLPRFYILNMMCADAENKFVSNHKETIIKELAELYEVEKNHYEDVGPKLMSIWFENSNLNQVDVQLPANIDGKMTKIIQLGFKDLAKKLWSNMTYVKQQRFLKKFTSIWLNIFDNCSYVKEKIMEMTVFLINNMTIEQRSEFLKHKGVKMLQLLSFWPYHDIVPQIFNEADCSYFNDRDFTCLFSEFVYETNCKGIDERFELFKKVQTNLECLYPLIPINVKEKLFLTHTDIKIEDNIVAAKLILNDKDLQNHKSQLLALCKLNIEQKLKVGEFEFCEKFVEEVFSDDEKKKFKENFIFLLQAFARYLNFEKCDKLLCFLAESDERRTAIKNQLNFVSITQKLIKEKYSWWFKNREKSLQFNEVNKYLNWQFNTPEKIRNYKEVLLNSNDFLYDVIYGFFSTPWYVKHASCFKLTNNNRKAVNGVEQMCKDFVKWLLGSEAEAEKFLKDDLGKNQEFIEKYIYYLLKTVHAGDFESLMKNFLIIFSVPPEIVFDLKHKICNEINDWIDYVFLEVHSSGEFEKICDLVSWVVPVNMNGEEIIANFINSRDGIRLYEKMFLTRSSYNCGRFEYFLNDFVKRYGRSDEIINHLHNEISNEEDKLAMILLVNLVKSGTKVDYLVLYKYAPGRRV